MTRPKGVLAIAIYFVILAVSAGLKLDSLGLMFAGLYAFLAYRLLALKLDGWWGARILSWVNILLILISAISLLLTVYRGEIPAQPVIFGTLIFVVTLTMSVQLLILRYLGKPQIAVLFQPIP